MITLPNTTVLSFLPCIFYLCWRCLRAFVRSPYELIPGPAPSSLLGYLPDLHDRHGLNFHLTMIERFGHVVRLKGGALSHDALYITDPLALRSILIKKQESFREDLFGIVHHGDGMTSVWGAEHRRQRKLINPIFNSTNISKLLPILWDIAEQLRGRIIRDIETTDDRVSPTEARIDLLDHFTRAALEFVGSGGIGQTFYMLEPGESPFLGFYEALKDILPVASDLFLLFPFFDSIRKLKPAWLRKCLAGIVNYLPWPSARKFKSTFEALHPVYDQIFERGKRDLENGRLAHSDIKDLTTLLIHANIEASEEDRMSDESIKANIGAIVHGGQETVSSILARFVHLLSVDQKLQNRMRNEISEALTTSGGRYPDFAELESLPILDAVCREVLRMYSPVTFIRRRTAEDIVTPLQYPILSENQDVKFDGSHLYIQKGTVVYIGISAANRSKAIWGEDADQFNIDRWLGIQPKNIHVDEYDDTDIDAGKEPAKLPGAYSNILTFLGGGRSCPGHRFAVLEMKVVLLMLLSSFSFSKSRENEIDWQLGITLTPYIKGRESEGAKVPVDVSIMTKNNFLA